MDSNPELDSLVAEKYDGGIIAQRVTNGWLIYPKLGGAIRTEFMVAMTGNNPRRLGQIISGIHDRLRPTAKLEAGGPDDGRTDDQHSGDDAGDED